MEPTVEFNAFAEPFSEQIINQLETVFDPDIGLDVYNLGLIYGVDLSEDKQCDLTLTFTGTGCTCIDTIPVEIKEKLLGLDIIDTVNINIVWDPAWTLNRISHFGRIALGINPN